MEKIIELLLNYVEPDDDITADTNIKSDLGMSSFDLACLSNDIFEEFGIILTADDFRNFITVGKLAKYIEENAK